MIGNNAYQKLFEKKIYLDLTGGSQTTPLQKSLILGVGEGLRPSRKQVEQAIFTSQITSQKRLSAFQHRTEPRHRLC
jgi:hypothetical protein